MPDRPIKTIYYSNKFERSYKKLIPTLKKIAKSKEKIIRENIFDQSLRTHKLTGELNNYWSFSLTFSKRVLFKFIDNESVLLIDIGDHRIYQ